jgi:hypothetical protein
MTENGGHARRRTTQFAAYAGDRLNATEAALAAARASGCTCTPEVILHGARATVHHDLWCALLLDPDLELAHVTAKFPDLAADTTGGTP